MNFDVFTRAASRRGSLLTLSRVGLAGLYGASLALGLGRVAPPGEARKKRRKRKKKTCKGGTRKCNGRCIPALDCCDDGDCDPSQVCNGGQCTDVVVPVCQNDGDCEAGEACINGKCVPGNEGCEGANDCAANESCVGGECRCAFPQKPCGDVCCASNEACVDGQCVVGQGTCAAGQNFCGGNSLPCNGNADCVCGVRLDDGETRCVQFVNDSRKICTCDSDFRCEQDFGAGTICIKGGASCIDCTLNTLGRCATICPGSN